MKNEVKISNIPSMNVGRLTRYLSAAYSRLIEKVQKSSTFFSGMVSSFFYPR